jgi:DNA primase|tara:strand:- start:1407 stop:2333 length:927 start_codon:yes stop_codon:yes gene_type:complete
VIKLSEKLQILKDAFGRCWNTGTETLFKCPKCNHDKLKMSINVDKNAFKCWVCNFSGNKISYLISKYAPEHYVQWTGVAEELDLSQYEFIFQETPEDIEQVVELPREFKTLTGQKSGDKTRALEYLYSRDISDLDILKWKIGYCDFGEYQGRIIIPSFNKSGKLNYFVARSFVDDWMKYKNPKASKNIVFNDLSINWDDDIVIVEGAFDAVRHDNCIPVLGSTLRENHKLFEKICRNKTQVYLALDEDAKVKELGIAKKFREYGVASKSIPVKPYADLAEMPRDEFLSRKQNADFITDLDYLHYKLDF